MSRAPVPGAVAAAASGGAERSVTTRLAVRFMVDKKLETIITRINDKMIFYL
jgi:hypothetical protein